MPACDAVHDREAEPGAGPAARAVEPRERLQHVVPFAGGDSGAAVEHFDECRRIIAARDNFRRAAAMAQRILDEVLDEPLYRERPKRQRRRR